MGELLVRADELRDACRRCDEPLRKTFERGRHGGHLGRRPRQSRRRQLRPRAAGADKFVETAPVLADYFAARGRAAAGGRGRSPPRGAGSGGGGGRGGGGLQTPPSAASWFEPPPPVPTFGTTLCGARGRGDEDQTQTSRSRRRPCLAGRRAPETSALARDAPTNDAGPAAEGEAGGSSRRPPRRTRPRSPGRPRPRSPPRSPRHSIRARAPGRRRRRAETRRRRRRGGGGGGRERVGAAGLAPPPRQPRCARSRLLETRLERIADRCATHVAELSDVARLCHARLAEMVKTKHKAEAGASPRFRGGRKMVRRTRRLWRRLNLTVSNDVLVAGGGRDGDPAAAAVPRAAAGGAAPRDPGTFSGTLRGPGRGGVRAQRRHHPRRGRLVMERLRQGRAPRKVDDGDGVFRQLPPRTRSRTPPARQRRAAVQIWRLAVRRVARARRLGAGGDVPPAPGRAGGDRGGGGAAALRRRGEEGIAEARCGSCRRDPTMGVTKARKRTRSPPASAPGVRAPAARAPSAQKTKTSGAARCARPEEPRDVSAARDGGLPRRLRPARTARWTSRCSRYTRASARRPSSAPAKPRRWRGADRPRGGARGEARRSGRSAPRAGKRGERKPPPRGGRRRRRTALKRSLKRRRGASPPHGLQGEARGLCAAAGPGAMSATAVELLRKKDLEGRTSYPGDGRARAGGAAPARHRDAQVVQPAWVRIATPWS